MKTVTWDISLRIKISICLRHRISSRGSDRRMKIRLQKGKFCLDHTYLIVAIEQGLLSVWEASHLVETVPEIERIETTLPERGLQKVEGVTINPDQGGIPPGVVVHQKTTKGPALQEGTLEKKDVPDLPEDILRGTLDHLQDVIGETTLVAGLPLESKEEKPKKRRFTPISKSAERSSMRTNVKFSGMASNGWPRHRQWSKMISMSRKNESNLKSTRRS